MKENDFFPFLARLVYDLGVDESRTIAVAMILYSTVIVLSALGTWFFTRHIINAGIYRWVKKTHVKWDDALADHKVLAPMSLFVPIIILGAGLTPFKVYLPEIVPFAEKVLGMMLTLVIAVSCYKFNNALEYMFSEENSYREVALRSVAQILNVMIVIIVCLVFVSIMFEVDPVTLFGFLGATTAIIMLIFKDTILGFVSSIQVASSRTLKAGDWIQVDQYGANGTLLEINLVTSTVRNFDNTIVSMPTYALVASGVINWSAMVQGNARRFMKSIPINAVSVRPVTKEDIDKYLQFPFIGPFIKNKRLEYRLTTDIWGKDTTEVYLDGERLSNLWVFINFVRMYLKSNPGISQDNTMLIRIMENTGEGIPVQIYAFTSTAVWGEYEKIQSDILSYLYSMVPQFGLLVFQRASQKLESLFVSDVMDGAGSDDKA